MRRVHRLEIAVGALVLAGLAGTVALVLTADKVRVRRTYALTAWLPDAGGLRYESPVTLAGIQVGRVEDIRAASVDEGTPESRLKGKVKATLKIDAGVVVPAEVQARLVSSGVFGDSFLALTPAEKDDGKLMPTDGTGAFSVQPGFFDEAATQVRHILDGVDDLLDAENRAAAKRLVANAADLAESAAAISKRVSQDQERLERIMANLDASSAALRRVSESAAERSDALLARTDRLLALMEDRVPGTLSRADAVLDATAATAQQVEVLLREQSTAIAATLRSLSDAAARGSRVLAALDGGEGVLGQLLTNRDLAKDLHTVAVDVGAVAEQLADKPSRLVFDDDDSTRAADKLKRDRAKMRRTLDEGLALPEAHGTATAAAVTDDAEPPAPVIEDPAEAPALP